MISCFLALVILVLFFFGLGGMFKWVIREHTVAEQYRRLERMQAFAPPFSPPTQKGWKITYKDGRTTKSVTIDCANEEDALREVVLKLRVGPRDVLSTEQVG